MNREGRIESDSAISGAASEPAGLNRLLAAAEAKSFCIVLLDDTLRLSRNLSGVEPKRKHIRVAENLLTSLRNPSPDFHLTRQLELRSRLVP